jgi:hypothetical protein
MDMVDAADLFVLLDTVPIDRKSWQTRNRIRARDGNVVWLSVPVHAHRGQPINEVEIANEEEWAAKHLRILESAYGYAPHWEPPPIPMHHWLVNVNAQLIGWVMRRLGITTPIYRASMLDVQGDDPYERIKHIVHCMHATELLNTPGAQQFLDGHDIGVPIRWHNYQHPVYDQGGAEFMPYLSVVDLLAWHGPDALEIIRSGRQ